MLTDTQRQVLEQLAELAVPADDVKTYYALVGSLTTPVVSLAQVG